MTTKCTSAFETKEKTLPGKWQSYNNGVDIFIISGGNVREADTIATISRGYKHRAKLIAAAPELLEACKNLLDVLRYEGDRCGFDYNEYGEVLKAKQAIKKAEA